MKSEKQAATKTWKVKTVNSGANPDEFEFPVAIPQDIEKGPCTAHALESFFDHTKRAAGH